MTEKQCTCENILNGCTCGAVVPYRIRSQGQWAVDRWEREQGEPKTITVEVTASNPGDPALSPPGIGKAHLIEQMPGAAGPIVRIDLSEDERAAARVLPPVKNVCELVSLLAKHGDGEALIRFAAVMFEERGLEYAGAVVNFYVGEGGDVAKMVEAARRIRSDPNVKGFLQSLKRVCFTDRDLAAGAEQYRRLIETSEETAWSWANWTEDMKMNARLSWYWRETGPS